MSQELNYTISGTYTKNGAVVPLPGVTSLLIDVSANAVSDGVLAATTGGVAVPLNGMTAPFGVLSFKNLDATNNITIKDAAAGHVICTLKPGEAYTWRAGSDTTAPTAVSAAATPLLQFCVLPP